METSHLIKLKPSQILKQVLRAPKILLMLMLHLVQRISFRLAAARAEVGKPFLFQNVSVEESEEFPKMFMLVGCYTSIFPIPMSSQDLEQFPAEG